MNKLKQGASSGFTIVELLIVIVVIGILAAITIVAYTGITAQANANSAKANANSLVDAANSAYAMQGYYPALTSGAFTVTQDGVTVKSPTGLTIQSTGLNGLSSNTTVVYALKGSAGAYTGICVGVKPVGGTAQTYMAGDATTGLSTWLTGTAAVTCT